MHGWLTEPLPDKANGIPVHTDFRRWILFLRLLEDEEVPDAVKPAAAARIVCRDPELAPGDVPVSSLLAFAAGGEETPAGGEGGDGIFDFAEDGERILASFYAVYGIDLTSARLHWWTFLALLRQLPPDSPFMRAVRLRTTDPAGIENDALRREIRRAKRAVRLRSAKGRNSF